MTQTVSAAAIACMIISGCVALALPVGLYFLVRKRFHSSFIPVVVGAASFVVAALILEGALHRALLNGPVTGPFLTSHWIIYALYGGLMAGLFEETGRLVCLFFILKRNHGQLGGAISYGIGHGGVEALILCTIPMLNYVISSITLNTGGMVGLLSSAPGQASLVEATASVLTGTPAPMFLISGLERVIAIFCHIALTVLVWMAATGRGPWGLYFLAILCHTIVNLPAGMYQYGIMGVIPTEIIMALLVALLCVVTYQIYQKCAQTYSPLLNYDPSDFGL